MRHTVVLNNNIKEQMKRREYQN